MAAHDNCRSELNINESVRRGGTGWEGRMRDTEEGKMGKVGWDDVFLEMGTSFYILPASSWPQ